MTKSKYNLPRGYLSHSQISLWESSKKSYKNQYFKGIEKFNTREMGFGKRVAQILETDDINILTEVELEVYNQLPQFDATEVELEGEVKGIKLLGYVDGIIEDVIQEIKTGKDKWIQEFVDNHDQLVMYSLIMKSDLGYIPKCNLIWIETQNMGEGKFRKIEMSGKVEKFERQVTEEEILEYEKKIVKVAKEISDAYTIFQLGLGETIDEELINNYVKARAAADTANEELDQAKAALVEYMEEKEMEEYEDDEITVYSTGRKVWTYPDGLIAQGKELNELKEKYDSDRKDFEKVGKEGIDYTIPKKNLVIKMK